MEYEINETPPKIKRAPRAKDLRKFAVIPCRVIHDRKITRGAIRVLIALSMYSNKAGASYVTTERLGVDLKISRQLVGRYLKQLELAGYITQKNNYAPSVKGKTRRIIYDAKLDQREVEQISGEKIEPFSAEEMRLLYQTLRVKKKPLSVSQSKELINAFITSLFECVSTEQELVILTRVIESAHARATFKTTESDHVSPPPPSLV
jgi:DNA-binding MarR family transcriptional regulator